MFLQNISFKLLLILSAIVNFNDPSLLGQTEAPFTVVKDEARIHYPYDVDFRLKVSGDSDIVSAELMYGTEALACGQVTTTGQPDFIPAPELDLTWRWDLSQGEIIPNGAQIWWQWQLTDSDGTTLLTEPKTALMIDRWFVWQSLSSENLTVYWYRGSAELARDLLDSAADTVSRLADETGLRLEEPIDIYLYDDPSSLRASVPGAPPWIGGVAFPEHSTIMMVADQEYLTESRLTLRHELGHVVFGHLTFNCVQSAPTWLSEGLAMVAESSTGNEDELLIDQAVAEERLLTLAQLEGSFSVHNRVASLAYAESYHFVRFLIESFGQEKMTSLITLLGEGTSNEQALLMAFGQDIHELESAWWRQLGIQELPSNDSSVSNASAAVPTFSLSTRETGIQLPTQTPAASAVPTSVTPTKQPTIMAEHSKTPELVAVLEATPTIRSQSLEIDLAATSTPIVILIAFLVLSGLFIVLYALLRRYTKSN